MSKNTVKITGLLLMMFSVFLILGGFFLKGDGMPGFVAPLCLILGLVLLATGTVMYKILKSDE